MCFIIQFQMNWSLQLRGVVFRTVLLHSRMEVNPID